MKKKSASNPKSPASKKPKMTRIKKIAISAFSGAIPAPTPTGSPPVPFLGKADDGRARRSR